MTSARRVHQSFRMCVVVFLLVGLLPSMFLPANAADQLVAPGEYRVTGYVDGMQLGIWDVQVSEGLTTLKIAETGRLRYTVYLDLDLEISALSTTKRSNGRMVDFWIPREYVQLELDHADVPVKDILGVLTGRAVMFDSKAEWKLEKLEVADE